MKLWKKRQDTKMDMEGCIEIQLSYTLSIKMRLEFTYCKIDIMLLNSSYITLIGKKYFIEILRFNKKNSFTCVPEFEKMC